MENASKALIIAGAILISILIIAIGMYIYSSSTESINSGIANMSSQEIEAFNANWTSYEGVQSGTQVKSLINKLMSNANTYQDEEAKVVQLQCEATNGVTVEGTTFNAGAFDLATFIAALNNAYTAIQAKHKYTVTFTVDSATSLISTINVAY